MVAIGGRHLGLAATAMPLLNFVEIWIIHSYKRSLAHRGKSQMYDAALASKRTLMQVLDTIGCIRKVLDSKGTTKQILA